VKFYYAVSELDPLHVAHPELLQVWHQANPGGSWTQVQCISDPLHCCVIAPAVPNVNGVWALATPWNAKEKYAEDAAGAPDGFTLGQSAPNPVIVSQISTAAITYSTPFDGPVSIKLYDGYGQELRTLVDGQVMAGNHAVQVNCTGLRSGSYFYQLEAGSVRISRKVLILN
jgi:hypothetical protein